MQNQKKLAKVLKEHPDFLDFLFLKEGAA